MLTIRPLTEEKEIIHTYLPPSINPACLQANGKLLSDKDIASIQHKIDHPNKELAAYIKNRLNNQKFGRYSKTLFKSPYGIINGKDGLYAIYNENKEQYHLTKPGRYGTIKLAQNLNTGEFFVLKTQLLKEKTDQSIFNNESHYLSKLQQSEEPPMSRIGKKSLLKGYLLMKYVKGTDLFELMFKRFTKNNPIHSWPDHFWLEVALKTMEANVQLGNVLQYDPKLENIMYDIACNQSQVIDFGFSKECRDPVSKYLCLQGHNAPELFACPGIYTEKSEVYALSTILQEILYAQMESSYGEPKQKNYIINRAPQFKPYSKEPIFKRDADISRLLTAMRDDDPEKRPTRAGALQRLTDIHEKYFGCNLYVTPTLTQGIEHIKTGYVIAQTQTERKLYSIKDGKVDVYIPTHFGFLEQLLENLAISPFLQKTQAIRDRLTSQQLNLLDDIINQANPDQPFLNQHYRDDIIQARQIRDEATCQERLRMKGANKTVTAFFKTQNNRPLEQKISKPNRGIHV